MGAEIPPPTPFYLPPREIEPEKETTRLFGKQIVLPMIAFFGTFFLIAIVGFSILLRGRPTDCAGPHCRIR